MTKILSARLRRLERKAPLPGPEATSALDAIRRHAPYGEYRDFVGLVRLTSPDPATGSRRYSWASKEAQRQGAAAINRLGIPLVSDMPHLHAISDEAAARAAELLRLPEPLRPQDFKEWQTFVDIAMTGRGTTTKERDAG